MRTLVLSAALLSCLLPYTAFAYDPPRSNESCLESFDAGKYSEAEACLREDLRMEPENAYALYLLGETVAKDVRRFTEAEGYYEQALESAKQGDPTLVPETMLAIGRLSIRLGDNERAVDMLSEFVREWPGHYRVAEAYDVMGVALEKLDRFDEALDSFKRAIKLDPDLLVAGYNMKNLQAQLGWLNIGRYYMRMGDLPKAEKHFRQALESHQNYVAAWFLLGEVMSRENRPTEAIRCYRRVLDLNPKYLGGKEPVYQEAREHLARGDEGDAEEALTLLDGLAYKDSDVILGEALVDMGRPAEAEAPLSAVASNADLKANVRAEAHFQLGRAYLAMGDHDRATGEFFRALQLMPSEEKYRKPPLE